MFFFALPKKCQAYFSPLENTTLIAYLAHCNRCARQCSYAHR